MALLISQGSDILVETLVLQQMLYKHPVFNFKRPKKVLLSSIYNRGTKQWLLKQDTGNLHKPGTETQIWLHGHIFFQYWGSIHPYWLGYFSLQMKLAPEDDDASSILCWVHLQYTRLFVVTLEIRIIFQPSILPP